MYKCNIVDNSVLSISAQCRCDAKYSNFVFKDNWNAFQSQNTLISLCEILTPLSIKKESKGKLKNSYHFTLNFAIVLNSQLPAFTFLRILSTAGFVFAK